MRIKFQHVVRPIIVALGLLGMTGTSRGDINWLSSFFATNHDSSGSDLSDQFVFYLGVFNPPSPGTWTPTPGNTAEWIDHWITADAVVYNPVLRNFSSRYLPAPLVEGVSLTGKQAYIWGVNRQYPNADWFLVTDPTWVWPTPEGSIDSFPQNWQVAGSTPVLGQVDQGGVHMKFAAVSNSLPPLLRSEIWLQTYFSQDEIDNQQATLSGWTADPNGNGRSNLLEYALGTHPRNTQLDHSPVVGFMEINSDMFLTLDATINPNTELSITAEVTSNLVDWFSDGTQVTLESQTPQQLLFRDLLPHSPSNPFRAIRLKVTLP